MQDIKYVSTLSNQGIFAITVSRYSSSKIFFRIGRHDIEERKNNT
jgi:hypothetical protein